MSMSLADRIVLCKRINVQDSYRYVVLGLDLHSATVSIRDDILSFISRRECITWFCLVSEALRSSGRTGRAGLVGGGDHVGGVVRGVGVGGSELMVWVSSITMIVEWAPPEII